MNTLPIKLRKNGFEYSQVLRNSKKAIYRQTYTEKMDYFEVFLIKSRPDRNFKGKMILGGENFPGNEDFGKTAWTFRTLEKAIQKFLAI